MLRMSRLLYFLWNAVYPLLWGGVFVLNRANPQAAIGQSSERFRKTLTDLGGIYVKLGQLMASRPDLVHPKLAAELENLFDRCPPEPVDDTYATIREELGLSVGADLPFRVLGLVASASFGSVFKIAFPDGRIAALKVQRREVAAQAERDLRTLAAGANLLDLLTIFVGYRLSDWIEELRVWTGEELDYRQEARRMEYFAHELGRYQGIRIPTVDWSLTRRRILAMDYFAGRWLTEDLSPINGAERIATASRLFQFFLFQTFEAGIFHADLHKGNVCILDAETIGIIDFGIVGFIPRSVRDRHLSIILSLRQGDIDHAFKEIIAISVVPPDADLAGFRKLLERAYFDWRFRSFQPGMAAIDRGAGALMLAVLRTAFQCGIAIDSHAVRYYRAFNLVDAVSSNLDDNFSQINEIDRYRKNRVQRRIDEFHTAALDIADTISFIAGLLKALNVHPSDAQNVPAHRSSRYWAMMLNLSRLFRWISPVPLFFAALILSARAFDWPTVADLVVTRSNWQLVAETMLLSCLLFWGSRLLRSHTYSALRSSGS